MVGSGDIRAVALTIVIGMSGGAVPHYVGDYLIASVNGSIKSLQRAGPVHHSVNRN
jgi:hypothetical protein